MIATAFAVVAMLAVTVTAASADEYYYGGWYYDNNAGGSEFLRLGDDSDGTYLHLRGADGWCGSRGASYAKMRRILNNNDGDYINWSVDQECTDSDTGIDYARICIENKYGESACSTYRWVGWRDWY